MKLKCVAAMDVTEKIALGKQAEEQANGLKVHGAASCVLNFLC
jgi:hypothetical protein